MTHRRPLTKAEIFADLDREAMDHILASAKSRHVEAKQQICATGQPASTFFVLKSGRAQYYRLTDSGTEIGLYLLTNGDAFGIGALLKQRMDYQADVAAITDCDLLVWKKAAIRALAARNPQLVENGLRIALDYLKDYIQRHLNLMSKTAEQRVAITLLDLARRIGRVRPSGIEMEITNDQISSFADTTRFTTSRLLKNFERRGAISKSRGEVVVHTPEALAIG